MATSPFASAHTRKSGGDGAVALAAQLPADARLILVFGSFQRDVPAIVARLAEDRPDAVVAGCTTMGEIAPGGFATDSVVALGLGGPTLAAAVFVDDLRIFEVEDATETAAALARGLGVAALDPARHVLITLTDGLSGLEELLVASLVLAVPEITLVGGSAGDDYRLDHTLVALGDRATRQGAVVVAVQPPGSFHSFRAHHFSPTEVRLVVTEADPVHRLVHELDGRPATEALAAALGVEEAALGEVVARRGVFGFGTRAHPYLRSVLAPRGTSLVMGGAVELGAVLTLMEGEGLVDRTASAVAMEVGAVSEPLGALLFQCGGRQLEARALDVEDQLFTAMTPIPAVGFVTYGEQFGPQQINMTLTGLVFGGGDVA